MKLTLSTFACYIDIIIILLSYSCYKLVLNAHLNNPEYSLATFLDSHQCENKLISYGKLMDRLSTNIECSCDLWFGENVLTGLMKNEFISSA